MLTNFQDQYRRSSSILIMRDDLEDFALTYLRQFLPNRSTKNATSENIEDAYRSLLNRYIRRESRKIHRMSLKLSNLLNIHGQSSEEFISNVSQAYDKCSKFVHAHRAFVKSQFPLNEMLACVPDFTPNEKKSVEIVRILIN